MKNTGRIVFSLFLVAVSGYAIYSASGWSFKSGFFPLAIAIPLLGLAVIQLALELFGAPEVAAEGAIDAEFSSDVSPVEARRRAIATFLWIAAFVFLVSLLSFPMAVPLFLFLYLRLQSKVSWSYSTVLTALTWGAFYALFERLIKLQFAPGYVQTWLGI
ncbi:MAG: tripartite tricarboxylate transporter TctB family protein [Candidatus Binatia bacterium]